MRLSYIRIAAVVAALCTTTLAWAEVSTVRIAKQFGISYLPLTVMESEKLLEKHGKAEGLDLKTEWLRFTGGSGMNDALLSGNLDFASGGVGPLLTIWGKTRSNLGVKAVGTLNAMPLYLVTTKPGAKTIADLSPQDRIAMPVAKTSIQGITLQMAAEKMFGPGQGTKFDAQMVSMGHPDAMAAMMGGKSEITAHFGSAPFQDQELKDPRAAKILDSYDVLGGPHTFNLVWATSKFADANPKVMKAFLAALEDAIAQIRKDPKKAADIYIRAESPKMTEAEVEAIIRDPKNEWTTTPKKILEYLDHMNKAGLVQAKTGDWKDIFFPGVHAAKGS